MALNLKKGAYVPIKKESENAASFKEIAEAFASLKMEEYVEVSHEDVSSSTLQAQAKNFIHPKLGEYLKISRVNKMDDDLTSKTYGKNQVVAIRLIKTKPPVVKSKPSESSESQG